MAVQIQNLSRQILLTQITVEGMRQKGLTRSAQEPKFGHLLVPLPGFEPFHVPIAAPYCLIDFFFLVVLPEHSLPPPPSLSAPSGLSAPCILPGLAVRILCQPSCKSKPFMQAFIGHHAKCGIGVRLRSPSSPNDA